MGSDESNEKCKICNGDDEDYYIICKDIDLYAYKGKCVDSCPPKTAKTLCQEYYRMCVDFYSNCDTCSDIGNANNMKCLTCSNNQIKYKQNCFKINDNKIKSFKNPYTSKITSCLELYSRYIIENTYECIDKPEKGYTFLIQQLVYFRHAIQIVKHALKIILLQIQIVIHVQIQLCIYKM